MLQKPRVPYTKRCLKDDPIKIAVIDTGMGYFNKGTEVKLCKFGHKDFTTNNVYSAVFNTHDKVPLDIDGHGTNVAGLIDRYAKEGNANYCIVVVKFYDVYNQHDGTNFLNEIQAIKYATRLHVDFINLSEGGLAKSKAESLALKKYIDLGGHVIAAAGNEGRDLDIHPYYPAMSDPRIIIVGHMTYSGVISPTSNRGSKVDAWEIGEGESSSVFGISMAGTSQAAAIFTGKTIARIKDSCYKNKVSSQNSKEERWH
jgi:subtilisin family serine protease